jgi:metal-responsive CopG/Arc/MetJ family transcriptional regulator
MTVSEFIFNLKRQNNIKLAFIIEIADSLLQQFDAHDKEISERCESLNSLIRNLIETDIKFH